MNIAIIGTAGRDDDGINLREQSFGEMFLVVNKITRTLSEGKPFNLVSGGAAWADHLAVFSFILGYPEKLFLELPCELTAEGKFIDTGERDFRTNPGGTSNHYHELFSKKVRFDSFSQLRSAAKKPNCIITAGGGFFERNSSIANKADHCIALTFGNGPELKDGGTMDTMKKFQKRAIGKTFHIDLHNMSVQSPAVIK
mgnify:FL=1